MKIPEFFSQKNVGILIVSMISHLFCNLAQEFGLSCAVMLLNNIVSIGIDMIHESC